MWKHRVHTVIWKPFKISFWNFIQLLSIRRRHTEHKNHNSCLYKFGVMSPLTLDIAACLSKPCLFHKMKTIQVIFIKQGLNLPYVFEATPLCSIMYKAASFQWDVCGELQFSCRKHILALTCISVIDRYIYDWDLYPWGLISMASIYIWPFSRLSDLTFADFTIYSSRTCIIGLASKAFTIWWHGWLLFIRISLILRTVWVYRAVRVRSDAYEYVPIRLDRMRMV